MGFKVRSFLIAIVGGTVLGFLAGYWVVLRDPTGVGASILAFPAILGVMIGTILLWAISFALWGDLSKVKHPISSFHRSLCLSHLSFLLPY